MGGPVPLPFLIWKSHHKIFTASENLPLKLITAIDLLYRVLARAAHRTVTLRSTALMVQLWLLHCGGPADPLYGLVTVQF